MQKTVRNSAKTLTCSQVNLISSLQIKERQNKVF